MSAWGLRSEAEKHSRTPTAMGKSRGKSLREIAALNSSQVYRVSGKSMCTVPGKTHGQKRPKKVLTFTPG